MLPMFAILLMITSCSDDPISTDLDPCNNKTQKEQIMDEYLMDYLEMSKAVFESLENASTKQIKEAQKQFINLSDDEIYSKLIQDVGVEASTIENLKISGAKFASVFSNDENTEKAIQERFLLLEEAGCIDVSFYKLVLPEISKRKPCWQVVAWLPVHALQTAAGSVYKGLKGLYDVITELAEGDCY